MNPHVTVKPSSACPPTLGSIPLPYKDSSSVFPSRVLFAATLGLLYFCFSADLTAEVIHLKNGDIVVGQVIDQSRTQMRVKTAKGIRTIAKTNIRRVSYSRTEEQAILRKRAAAERRRREAATAAEAARKKAVAERVRREREAAELAGETIDETPAKPITPGGLVLRSAVLPGLGHIGMDKPITGATYMGLGVLAFGNLIQSRNAAVAAESQNADDVVLNLLLTFAPNDLDSLSRIGINFFLNSIAQEPYQATIRRYDQSILLFSGIYLLQLAHIVYDAILQPRSAPAADGSAARATGGWDFHFAPVISTYRPTRTTDYAGGVRYTHLF